MSPLGMAWAMGMIGLWMIQDGLASIWHYWGKEGWSNQMWRLPRVIGGLALVIMSILWLIEGRLE